VSRHEPVRCSQVQSGYYMSRMTIWRSNPSNAHRFLYFQQCFWNPINAIFHADSLVCKTARRIYSSTLRAFSSKSEDEKRRCMQADMRLLGISPVSMTPVTETPTTPQRRTSVRARQPPNIKVKHAKFKRIFMPRVRE